MTARPAAKKVSNSVIQLILLIRCATYTNVFPAAIESRVARIKARVAELTGNMDNSSVRR
jgi:hypothetical protein